MFSIREEDTCWTRTVEQWCLLWDWRCVLCCVTLWGRHPAGAPGWEAADALMVSSGEKRAAARPPFPQVPPQLRLWSAGASWLAAERCPNEVKVQLFQKPCLRLFVCSPFTLRHSFSVVNILRGKNTSAAITERSPLLRFSQDDRWVNGFQVPIEGKITNKETNKNGI